MRSQWRVLIRRDQSQISILRRLIKVLCGGRIVRERENNRSGGPVTGSYSGPGQRWQNLELKWNMKWKENRNTYKICFWCRIKRNGWCIWAKGECQDDSPQGLVLETKCMPGPFLELGEKVTPFWDCGGKSIVSLRPVQFDMARSCLHGVIRKVFRYESGSEGSSGEIEVWDSLLYKWSSKSRKWTRSIGERMWGQIGGTGTKLDAHS